MTFGKPTISVVIATYNRGAAIARLLTQLAGQTLAADSYEVIVVDDGSTEPVETALARLDTPYTLRVITQVNGGPAVARHTGIQAATGDIIVIVDDDMQIGADFLAGHLACHPSDSRHVVLGQIVADSSIRLPIFERYHLAMIERMHESARAELSRPVGSDLHTGNVSFRRADYFAVGGFDQALRLSEDAELGIRLETLGARFLVAPDARAVHASDHVSLSKWIRRSFEYGGADVRVSAKHPDVPNASPWRFLFKVNPISRPFMVAAVLVPWLVRPVAWFALRVALAADALGAERFAIIGTTFAYGLHYYRGVRHYSGSVRRVAAGLMYYIGNCPDDAFGRVWGLVKLIADIRADHDAILRADAKYKGKVGVRSSLRLVADSVQRIGLQMMVAYRVMRYLRATRPRVLAKLASRMIRHLYGADIHWDAELAPGVMIVHGMGLVISHEARVGRGCVLFHRVTLGENTHPETRELGSPTLEADVHVGPGATILGPITVGRGTKITAGALVMQSVPRGSLVETPPPSIRARATTGRLARAISLIALMALPADARRQADVSRGRESLTPPPSTSQMPSIRAHEMPPTALLIHGRIHSR